MPLMALMGASRAFGKYMVRFIWCYSRFILRVCRLLLIRWTQRKLVLPLISKSTINRQQKRDRGSDLPLFSYGYQKCLCVAM